MKKLFLSALLVLLALTGAMAAWPDRPIIIVKKTKPPIDPIPVGRPLSVTEDDNFLSLEAALDDIKNCKIVTYTVENDIH